MPEQRCGGVRGEGGRGAVAEGDDGFAVAALDARPQGGLGDTGLGPGRVAAAATAARSVEVAGVAPAGAAATAPPAAATVSAAVAAAAAVAPGAPGAGVELAGVLVDVAPVASPRTPVRGHAANGFAVGSGRRWTHLRINQHPDGGIARLRVHGEVLPDPRWLALLGTVDVACVVNGGVVEEASDGFHSSPGNTIMPGLSQKQDDGWETRRRRDKGNDWIAYRLAGQCEIRAVEVDTANLKGNAAGWVSLSVKDGVDGAWTQVLPRTRLEPDSPHRLPLVAPVLATHARIDVYPDGGFARLRLHGRLTDAGAAALTDRAARAAL
ncbi:hypothetical protein [Streptomyces sp. NPDC059957]|uniref:hypothetical protein n=1 Tax=Streptomyces sp. NPDC059957 TaxID=3347016 RepID=UPI00364CB388